MVNRSFIKVMTVFPSGLDKLMPVAFKFSVLDPGKSEGFSLAIGSQRKAYLLTLIEFT